MGITLVIITDVKRPMLIVGGIIAWTGDSGLLKMERASWVEGVLCNYIPQVPALESPPL